jgi:hypothetical protein
MGEPVFVLTLLLPTEEDTGFDSLTGANDDSGGGGVVLSSDLVCRGGIGGGDGRFVEFIFDSVSINRIL